MSLPTYQNINLKSSSFEELETILSHEINLKHPVVINMKNLDLDMQREALGLIENYFVSNGLSFKFPYPVYAVTEHEPSISNLSLVRNTEELPKFFKQKEGKMNVKEGHIAGKNKLLQQEVQNSDASASETELKVYGQIHKRIFELESEILVYRMVLSKLTQVKKNG